MMLLPGCGCLPWRRGFGIPGSKGLVGGYMPTIVWKRNVETMQVHIMDFLKSYQETIPTVKEIVILRIPSLIKHEHHKMYKQIIFKNLWLIKVLAIYHIYYTFQIKISTGSKTNPNFKKKLKVDQHTVLNGLNHKDSTVK